MKVKLKDIKPSTPRVRKEIDAQGIEDLAESITEMGIICPPKVRKNGDGYITVYGHRRIAAARMAGLEEIDAIVEDVDDMNLMLQAGMENLSKEDMSAEDKGEWVSRIRDETGWTIAEIGRQTAIPWTTLNEWSQYYEEKMLGTAVPNTNGSERVRQTIEIAKELEDPKDKKKVAKKVAEEDLTWRQARTVAREYKRVKEGYGEKQAAEVLKTPYAKSGLDPAAEWLQKNRKKKPVAVEKKGEIVFQWVRDPRVVEAEECLRTISATVSDIALSDQDKGGGKAVLENLAGRTQNILNQINEVLDGYDN